MVMKRKPHRIFGGGIIVLLLAFCVCFCGLTALSGCAEQSRAAVSSGSGSGKAGSKDKQKKELGLEQKIGNSLKKGRPVFLYFYSDAIDDSLDQKPVVEKAAKANGADVYAVKTDDYPNLRYAYEVQYVPTVFLIRPDAGLTEMWAVDMEGADLVRALKAKINPNEKQKEIAQAIKDNKPQLIFFMSEWCGYCKATMPEVQKLKSGFPGCVRVVIIDTEEYPEMQDPYMVQGVPVILLAGGAGVFSLRTGYPAGYDEFLETFESMGVDMKKCGKSGAAKKAGEST
jgi:thiol-disulfide isomerase/thioredoxin